VELADHTLPPRNPLWGLSTRCALGAAVRTPDSPGRQSRFRSLAVSPLRFSVNTKFAGVAVVLCCPWTHLHSCLFLAWYPGTATAALHCTAATALHCSAATALALRLGHRGIAMAREGARSPKYPGFSRPVGQSKRAYEEVKPQPK
jgi:hypothetical protein